MIHSMICLLTLAWLSDACIVPGKSCALHYTVPKAVWNKASD